VFAQAVEAKRQINKVKSNLFMVSSFCSVSSKSAG
jgi:hypothetical protein